MFLEGMKNSILNNPSLKFEIVCYPDNDKNAQFNKELTDERAKALLGYLTNAGITADRLNAHGSETTDNNPKNAPPQGKAAKGKRYIGTSYVILKSVN